MTADFSRRLARMDLDPERVRGATTEIDPVFLRSPHFVDEQLCAELGRSVVVKPEILNPLHSFKGRGADFLVRERAGDETLVCSTAGNFGQAVAYAARTRGRAAEIFVQPQVNPAKLARMRALGADVVVTDHAPRAARERAEQHPDRVFVEDGREPEVAEGAGTVAVELLAEHDCDTVVVPVGDGALINGMACWIKAVAPAVRVIGAGARAAPGMERAWRTGERITDAPTGSIAEGITTRAPVPESVARMRALGADVVLVDDQNLLAAMRLAARTLGVLLEPAAATGLAALAVHDIPGTHVATVLTGSNPREELLGELLAP